MSKKVLILLMTLIMVFSSFNMQPIHADEAVKPDSPSFKLKVSEDESVFTFTISKTSNADGYRIYAKEPGSKKYRIVATIKKNGKKARTCTYSPFNPGQYAFKIKAYHKNGKSKVWSDASAVKKITVKSDILSRVPVGIRFADDTVTEFRFGNDNPGGSDRDRYKFEYECDEDLENAEIRLFIVNSDGTRADDPLFNYDDVQMTIGATRLGECYAVLYAFGKSTDVDCRNPVARSEMIKLTCMDENGNTGPKYADITFRDGYAYFGTAPTELVTDKELKSKIINTADRDHEFYLLDGDVYRYDGKFDLGPFKYVPAEWRILEQTDDYVLLMNNSIIGGGGYDGYKETKTTTWKTSCLYYMLNHYNDYTKDEKTFGPVLRLDNEQRVLMDMDICGVNTKVGIPTLELLTDKKYGFSTSLAADKNRIVSPSIYSDLGTNHNATRHGLKLFGCYWVANEKAGETICVDQNGKILVGEFDCNVYEIGVVNVIKVDLKLCNVINK
ncbi:MAG: hypothetical protein K5795_02515 [Lachnospiraceae bacterium]|nr:hypothetical protein [Lachnospiraceae bacterium]